MDEGYFAMARTPASGASTFTKKKSAKKKDSKPTGFRRIRAAFQKLKPAKPKPSAKPTSKSQPAVKPKPAPKSQPFRPQPQPTAPRQPGKIQTAEGWKRALKRELVRRRKD